MAKKEDKPLITDDGSAVVIGVRRKQIAFTSVNHLETETDFE